MLITSLASWGLPQAVVDAYSGLGLQNLYPWQAAALESGADGSNLVYCAPTSGGKSVVAEVLMLRRLHQRHARGPKRPRWQQGGGAGRALVILPYISVVAEKAAHLSGLVRGLRWVVRGYMGASQGTPLSKRDEVIAVCTPEKANMALHLLLAEQRLHELVAVVVDEAHMVADPQRGALLEVLLTKLRAAARPGGVQVVAMSATMGGLDALSTWLDARLFMTNFRPVPLTEHVVMGGRVYRKTAPLVPGGEVEGVLEEEYVLPGPLGRDRDQLVHLVSHVVGAGHSVLVFCSSRAAAEAAAGLIAEMLPAVLPLRVVSPEVEAGRRALVEGLREELGGGLSPKLEKLLLAGVAYHHAGLTAQERGAVEAGYRAGAITVLTATSTLAAGVNLPARRVILRTIHQGAGPVSRAQYLQMIGRAGRAGQCSFGEAFLMCNADPSPSLTAELGRLLVDRLPPLTSQLVGEGGAPGEELLAAASSGALGTKGVELAGLEGVAPGLQRLLLEGIAVGIAQDGPAIEALLRGTLLARQVEWPWLSQVGRLALAALRQRRLISLPPPPVPGQVATWRPSPLGAAVTCSGLPPDSGLALHGRLDELRVHVVLGTASHLLYALLGEPLFEVFDWRIWQRLLQRLSPAQQRVADVVGVDEDYVMRCLRGGRADPALSAKHGRLAAALLLDALAEGATPAALEEAWGAPMGLSKAGFTRGQLQHWQQDVAKWAGMAAVLADKAGYWQLEVALAQVGAQLAAGVRPELLPLMQVPGMHGEQARGLHAAGLVRPDLVAAAPAQEVVAALAAGGKRPAATGAARGLITHTMPPGTRAAAERLLAACRQHIVAEALADNAEKAGEGAPGPVLADLEEEGGPGSAALDPQLGLLAQLGPGGGVRLSGQLVARRVLLRQPDQVQQVLAAWRLQPAFAWALVLAPGTPGATGRGSGGGLPPDPAAPAAADAAAAEEDTLSSSITRLVAGPPQPLALALCWSERDVVLLQLPPPRAQVGAPPQQQQQQEPQQQPVQESIEDQVYNCVQSVFGDPHRVALCWDAPSSVPALCGALGVGALAARVDDPLAAFCCWAPEAVARAGDPPPVGSALLKLVCSRVTPEYAMKVPLSSEGETWAARQATYTWVAMPVVWRLLAAARCSTVYRPLLASTQDAMAAAAGSGVRLLRPQAAAAVAEVGWALQQLAKVLSQQLQGAVASPQALAVLLEAGGAPGMGGGQRERRKATPNTPEAAEAAVLAAIRAACKGGQQAWLQLLQAALTYCRLAAIHTAGTALLAAVGAMPHPLLRLGSTYSSLPGGISLTCSPLLQAMLVTGVGLPWCPLAVVGPLLRHAPEPLPGVVRMLCRSGPAATDPWVAGYCGQVVWPHTSDLPQPGWAGEGRPAGSGSVAYLEAGSRAMRRGWVGAGHIQEVATSSSSGPGLLGPQPAAAAAGAAGEVFHSNQQQRSWSGHQHQHNQQQQQQYFGHPQQQQHHSGPQQLQQQQQQQPQWQQQQQQEQHHQQHQWQQQQHHHHHQQQQGQYPAPEPPQVSYATWCWQLRPALAPAAPDQVFLGCELAHLDLLVCAGLGQDPALLAATQAPDPPAAAAAAWQPHWPACAGRALAAVAAGCVEGVPVPSAAAPAVLWQLVVSHLVAGGSPGQLGKVVGLEAGAAGALLDSLTAAFPGLAAALERAVTGSAKTGYVVSPAGRRLLCAQPPPSTSFSTREARLRHEARRLAISLALSAARGDLLLALVAGLSTAWGLDQGGARRACSAGGGAGAAGEGGVGQACWALVSEAALVVAVDGPAMMGAWGVGRHAVGAALAQVWPGGGGEEGAAGLLLPPFTWWWGATLDPVAGNLLVPRGSHAGR